MASLFIPVTIEDHMLGNLKAPVTAVEYGDFECPHCGEAYPIFKRIQENMGSKLLFVYRHFPLTQSHPHAYNAARAAEAAGKQGKFWEMHDVLFENQEALEKMYLESYATDLGLDIESFLHDYETVDVTRKIDEDIAGGIRSGVNGTPTLFINNTRYDGSYEYDEIMAELRKAVRREEL